MLQIQILGIGCKKSRALKENVIAALDHFPLGVEVEEIGGWFGIVVEVRFGVGFGVGGRDVELSSTEIELAGLKLEVSTPTFSTPKKCDDETYSETLVESEFSNSSSEK